MSTRPFSLVSHRPLLVVVVTLALLAVLLLAILVTAAAGDGAGLDAGGGGTARLPLSAGPIDAVVVDPGTPWLLAAACPVTAQLERHGGFPLLLAGGAPPSVEATRLLQQAEARRVLFLAGNEVAAVAAEGLGEGRETMVLSTSPLEASLSLARRFWGTSPTVVLASLDDPEAVILGSMLAGRMVVPLLLADAADRLGAIEEAVRTLRAEEVLAVTAQAGWGRSPEVVGGWRTIRLRPPEVYRRWLQRVPSETVENVVLARVPDAQQGYGPTAWLAPYWSLARHSPLVLVRSSDAAEAEVEVDRFITTWHLRPQTVTVLADFPSIGKKPVRIPLPPESPQPGEIVGVAIEPPGELPTDDFHAEEWFPLPWSRQEPQDECPRDRGYGDSLIPDPTPTCYELEIEPCMPTDYHQTATLGVGRIPFGSLEDASILFARGLVRERLFHRQAARVLMIANPGEPGMTLPLCETISRVTAAEFRNARVAIDEFYGPACTGDEVLRAAGDANLIVFQGHLYHQHLFRQPYEEVPDEYYGDWAYLYWSNPPAVEYIAGCFRVPSMSVLWHLAVDRLQLNARVVNSCLVACSCYWDDVAATREPPALVPDASDDAHGMTVAVPADGVVYAEPANLDEPLAGFPVVVLQSCDSLDEGIMRRVHELSGSALLSTVTYMYSASGSAFVKAVCDGVLYRRATLGEAVRDARNYFFCLQDLKNVRGHHQQAKSQRAALSFQLWGDPQLRVVPPPAEAPKIRPVAARWSAPDELTIDVPRRRLERAASEAYRLRAFPGSGTAGLVRRAKDGTWRRLTPIYFFRLPLPAAFEARGFASVQRPGDTPKRAVFRVDPWRRYLYVLYYPAEETPRETFTLKFGP